MRRVWHTLSPLLGRHYVIGGISALALASLLAGCAYPAGYQEWQWQQWNPNYVPLPGDVNH